MNATTPFLIVFVLVFGPIGFVGLHESDDAVGRGIASFLVFMAVWALALLIR